MMGGEPLRTTEADLVPLLGQTRDGNPLTRSSVSLGEIIRVLDRPIGELANSVGTVSPTCLLYVVRHLRPNRDTGWYNKVIMELLARADRVVSRVCGGLPVNVRNDIRQEMRSWMLELIYSNDAKLDSLEAMFTLVLKSRAIDQIRKSGRRRGVVRNETEFGSNNVSAIDVVDGINLANSPPLLGKAEASVQLASAMAKLTDREQEAVINVHAKGLKEGSSNPDEMTAATEMNISDRRVRQLLTSAEKKLTGDGESGK